MDSSASLLYKSSKTVFSSRDLAVLWKENRSDRLKSKTAYYVKRGVLLRFTAGIFAKQADYEPRELATKIYTPSYISFETALRDAAFIFQYYKTLFVAAPWSRTKKFGTIEITFRKMKDSVLYNPAGILHKNQYAIASPERAFLDMIYLFPRYYFDYLGSLRWDICWELVDLYDNDQLKRRLKKYQKEYAE